MQKKGASGTRAGMTLDMLARGATGRIVSVDWSSLAPDEAKRLRTLGIDEGATVEIAHRGVFGGHDPIAITVGRMTVALRRAHARAMEIELQP